MTETSYFWDGIVTGDAALAAPSGYTEQQFARVFSKILGSDSALGFVVPDYLNELEVSANSPAAANVIVKSGAAFVKGMNYESDATTTLSIAANASGNPRLDRIILRVDWATKTIRLVVLQGTAAATPALPTLTQVFGTTWEISLANVWAANGFATIAATEVHDERSFMPSYGMVINQIAEQNLLANSEYITCSIAVGKPDLWVVVGSYTGAFLTKPSEMFRSRAIQMTTSAISSGIRQITRVRGGEKYALRGLMNVTAGDVGVIEIVTNGASPLTVTKYVRRTGAWIDYSLYFTTPSDATYVEVRLLGLNSGDVVSVGQFLLMPGRIPGAYRPFREFIPTFAQFLAFFSVNTKATGTYTLHFPTIDTNSQIFWDAVRAVQIFVNADYSSGTTVDVELALQTVGGGITRQGIAARNTGAPVDTLRNAEWIMPFKEDQSFEAILSASASPVSYNNMNLYVGGVYT